MGGPDVKKLKALDEKIEKMGLSRSEFEEKFVKSSGRGGQKVNKTSSAVFIRHVPTGLSVKVGKHRSQHLNRFLALRQLVEEIEARREGRHSKRAQAAEKIRRQKSRRKRKHRQKKAGPLKTPPTDTV